MLKLKGRGVGILMVNEDSKGLKPIFKIIIFIGFVLLVVVNFNDVLNIFRKVYSVVAPLLLGLIMAFILNILMVTYEKILFPKSKNKIIIKSRRGVSILLAILTIILVIIFFLNIVIPQVAQFISLLIKGFPGVYDKVLEWAYEYSDEIPVLQQRVKELNMNGEQVLKKSLEILANWTFGTVSFIGSAFSVIVQVILALTFSVYILASKEDLKYKFNKLFKAFIKVDKRKRVYEILKTANETFSNYIIGQCKEAVILGVLCTIGMIVLRFPYANIIGPVIGMTALIPMVGAYIGAALGFLLVVTIDFLQAVLFLVFIIILQQFEGNVIYPKVVGGSIGLPGIWVFAAVIVGGGLMGITGILFGVPLLATIYKLLSKSVNEKLRTNKK